MGSSGSPRTPRELRVFPTPVAESHPGVAHDNLGIPAHLGISPIAEPKAPAVKARSTWSARSAARTNDVDRVEARRTMIGGGNAPLRRHGWVRDQTSEEPGVSRTGDFGFSYAARWFSNHSHSTSLGVIYPKAE